MRGRSCTQPFLVEKQTRYPLSPRRPPSPAPLGESIAPSSAPVCALGHLPPKGKALGVGMPLPVCKTTPPSPPSRWAGRYGRWFMGRRPGKKRRRPPAGSPQTRKGGSREEEPLPPWCSFLRLSSKESRAPPPESAGPPGRCAPRAASELPTRRVRSTAPPQKRDTPKGIPTFIPPLVGWNLSHFLPAR